MSDFITQCANYAALVAWYATVPSTVPSGDRYIAECAAGNYAFTGVTWTGKATNGVGAIIIRPAAGAKSNSPNTNPAREASSGIAVFDTSFGGVNSYGCTGNASGFVFEDCSFLLQTTNGQHIFGTGCLVNRAVSLRTSTSAILTINQAASMINSICVSTVAGTPAAFQGTGAQTNNTLLTFTDQAAMSLSGSFNNAVWKNVAAFNLAGSPTVDPWPTPPTNFFASCTNNATSFATIGNCPGTSCISNVSPAAALVNVASSAALNARPKAGSALFNAGVVVAGVGGIDWYSDARSGSTPTIGAVELTTSPIVSIIAGTPTLDEVAPTGTLTGGAPTSITGTAVLDEDAPTGTFTGVTSLINGGVVFDDQVASGSMSPVPGVLHPAALKNNTGTLLINEVGITVYIYVPSTGVLVVAKTSQTTDASALLVVSDVAMVAGTSYTMRIVLASGAEGLCTVTAS